MEFAVLVIKRCVVDQRPFEAKRATAKYCSPACRLRAHRGKATISVLSGEGAENAEGALAASTRRRLEQVGRLDGELGVAALLLAARLDRLGPVDTGAGVAALMKEFRATLAEAVKDAEGSRDTLDEIRQAAALKLVRGSA